MQCANTGQTVFVMSQFVNTKFFKLIALIAAY